MKTLDNMNPTSGTKIWTKQFVSVTVINLFIFIGFHMTMTGLPVYVTSLGASTVVAGLLTTMVTGATLFVRPFSGMMLDRLGRKSLFLIGLAIMAVCISGYAVFPILGVILVLRFAQGLSWGITSTATSTIAADFIPRKRFAEGMGYFALSGSIAVAIAPALSLSILQGFGAVPMLVLAAGITFFSLILAFFIKTVKIEKKERSKGIKISDIFDKKAALPALIAFLINCSFGSITTFIALHGQAEGVNNIWMYFIVYAVVTLVVRPVTGRIIDKNGFFWPGILSIVGVVISLVIIAFSHSIFMFCLGGFFGGIGIGTGMGTLQTMAVASALPQRRGVATGTFFFGFDAGIGAGAAIAGVMAGIFGYGNMFLFMAIFPVIALVIFLTVIKKRITDYNPQ